MLYRISINEEDHPTLLQALSDIGVQTGTPDLDIESFSIKGIHISMMVTEHFRAELTEEQLIFLKLRVNVNKVVPCYTIAP